MDQGSGFRDGEHLMINLRVPTERSSLIDPAGIGRLETTNLHKKLMKRNKSHLDL